MAIEIVELPLNNWWISIVFCIRFPEGNISINSVLTSVIYHVNHHEPLLLLYTWWFAPGIVFVGYSQFTHPKKTGLNS